MPAGYRVTHYEIKPGQFAGTTYTLTLQQNLAEDYFVIVHNGETSNTHPQVLLARVSSDPHGNFTSSTSADQIELSRVASTSNWLGTVVVVECTSGQATSGFTLREVVEISMGADAMSGVQTDNTTLAAAHTSRTVPFGGYRGGGVTHASTAQGNGLAASALRLRLTGSDNLETTREGGASTKFSLEATVYVVEWGTDTTVQAVDIDDIQTGGDGSSTAHYTTAAISSVVRDNTWLWVSARGPDGNGTSDRSAWITNATIGNGVDQYSAETTVAVARGSASIITPTDVTVYVIESAGLAVDHRYRAQAGGVLTSFTQTVDAASSDIFTESYSSTAALDITEGARLALGWFSSDTSGTFLTGALLLSFRPTASTTITIQRQSPSISLDCGGWLTSVDFGVGGAGQIAAESALVEFDASAIQLAAESVLVELDAQAVRLAAESLLVEVDYQQMAVAAETALVEFDHHVYIRVAAESVLVELDYEPDPLDLQAINYDVTEILDGIEAAEARVRALVESGVSSDRDWLQLASDLTGYSADIRDVRADLDSYDVTDALLYQSGADSIRLWRWERRLRRSLVGLEGRMRRTLEQVVELAEGRPSRLYAVKSGDTLQTIAARQLGDWTRWRELATINGLDAGPVTPGIVIVLPDGS